MGEKLVRLCDGITGHGLVDYEYGVWEELIIHSMSPPQIEPTPLLGSLS